MKKLWILGMAILVLMGLIASGQGKSFGPSLPKGAPQVRVQADYGKMPLFFIPNQGQMDGRALFSIRGKDKSIYFSPEGLTFVLTESSPSKPEANLNLVNQRGRGAEAPGARRWTLKLDFVGADPGSRPVGVERQSTVISYFKGRPEEWHTGLPAYSRIAYTNLWPGIDLVYSGTGNKLKYEFVVRPGADPASIKLAYRGAQRVAVDREGRLEITTPLGSFQDDRPTAFQALDGKRVEVPLAYDLEAGDGAGSARQAYGFRVGSYDKLRPLVLDPTILIYCGYIGGAGEDYGVDVAVDGNGCAYVAGYTQSDENSFPVAVGPSLVHNLNKDAFVAKVKADGTGLVYCGFIGGSGDDIAAGIAVDASGNAYVSGTTTSSEATFPVAVGPSLTFQGGPTLHTDAFVAKVKANGTGLVYCGYIGGTNDEQGARIAVDGTGHAYITGSTGSSATSFPKKVGPRLAFSGGLDAFVAKVEADGSGLVYCGYIGGTGGLTNGYGIALDGSGNAYVVGSTTAGESVFPVSIGPILTNSGGQDAFVAKVKSDGTGFSYCGYIGGSKTETAYGVAVDGLGYAYVAGETGSDEKTFPVKTGPDLTYNGGDRDAFVAKVLADGTGLAYCGYIGGSGNVDSGNAIGVAQIAGAWTAFVTGSTNSSESDGFPVTLGPSLIYGGVGDGFVARVAASGAYLVYCGYIGGAGTDDGFGLAVDSAGTAYVCGRTNSTLGFPAAVGPDLSQNGSYDAFAAKVTSGLVPPVMTNPPNGAQQMPLTSDLIWVDTNDAPQEKDYYLRYKIAGGSYAYYASPQNTTSLDVPWLTLNTTYYWNIQARSSNTTDFPDSAWANGGADFVFRTVGSYVLFAPILISPANGSMGQPTSLTLAWSDPNNNPQETKYRIRVKPAGGNYANFTAAKNATSFLLTGRQPNKTYYWNVQAVGNGGTLADSPWGNGGVDWSFKTAAPVKLAPPTLASPANGAVDQPQSVTLRWNDTNSSPQELGYQVRIKPAGGAYAMFNTGQNVAQYVKSGLLKNKAYFWNVRAKGDGKGLLTSAWANAGADWKFTTKK